MSDRISKVNKLIKKNISEIMSRELNLKPGIFLTVSKVDTSKDLRYARVFVSVFPEKEANYVFTALKKEIFTLQGKMNKKLAMRPLPRITFLLDTTEAQADEIEKILKKIN